MGGKDRGSTYQSVITEKDIEARLKKKPYFEAVKMIR